MSGSFQGDETSRSLREELEATRASISSYTRLVEELPALYERKFTERVEPLLERRQQLLQEQDLLKRQLLGGSPERCDPAGVSGSRPIQPDQSRARRRPSRKHRACSFSPLSVVIGLGVLVVTVAVAVLQRSPRQGPQTPRTAPPPSVLPITPSPSQTPSGTSIGPDGQGTITVREGDTLSEIAEAHNVSLRRLVGKNGISDPHVLAIDQVLVLP